MLQVCLDLYHFDECVARNKHEAKKCKALISSYQSPIDSLHQEL